jgi:hypothetical protein
MAQNISRFFRNNMSNGRWTWNVRNVCRAGSLTTVARELVVQKLDLVGVQVVRSDRRGTEPAGNYTFFYSSCNENRESGIGFLLSCVGFQVLTAVLMKSIICWYIMPFSHLKIQRHVFATGFHAGFLLALIIRPLNVG